MSSPDAVLAPEAADPAPLSPTVPTQWAPGEGADSWRVLAAPAVGKADRAPASLRRTAVQASLLVVLVVLTVAAAAVLVNQRLAKQEAVHEVAGTTDLLAESIVQPALTDAMATDPAAATAGLAPRIRGGALNDQVVRVKLWAPSGQVLYSDESRLIGRVFVLDDEARLALTSPRTVAGITDSARPENAFESRLGKLLEVYRPVWTPSGHPLLLEIYYRYSLVAERGRDLWRGFSGIVLSSLAVVLAIIGPLLWTFYRRARTAQTQRETMMRRAVEASTEERKRIAGTLHDGVVQQLAGAAFTIAGEARHAAGQGDVHSAERLASISDTVRDSVAGMRSLLVDIYPPSLQTGGLASALGDLAKASNGSDVRIVVDVDREAAAALDPAGQRATFRVAQECLRNALKHAQAHVIELRLREVPGAIALEIIDDGEGFDVDEAVRAAAEGHFGLRLSCDEALAVGATLAVSSSSRGTHFRMEIPTP